MKIQVTKVSVGQSAKVMAMLYLLLSIPFVAVFVAFALAGGQGNFIFLLLLAPVFYAAAAYVGTAFSAWLYNVAAKKVGGFEYTTSEIGEAS
ncbi:hypothetical protein [Telluria aromaticivorans]|uniref:Uncharacterized protein n=1 Tax=Telluria aromaticivorans TaxID=2725995 RepID=A0A7Y2NY46_9BURK|nr:hypothetical protein [Telluria aromaticivorans]NNG22407.1 hypothetical protein [Telluria aromaticivorans]